MHSAFKVQRAVRKCGTSSSKSNVTWITLVRQAAIYLDPNVNYFSDDQGNLQSSPRLGPATSANIVNSGYLPTPQLGIISEIERAIKALARTQVVKERICDYIQHEVSSNFVMLVFNLLGHIHFLHLSTSTFCPYSFACTLCFLTNS